MALREYVPNDFEVFIGLDTDKNSIALTVRDGNKKKQSKMPANPEQFYQYVDKHYSGRKVVCAYEAGPTGFYLYDYLKARDTVCYITAPASIPKAPNEKVKTNKIDSGKIAEYLMSGEFKPIRVPEGPYRELRDLVKIRIKYASESKKAKQRIKALFLNKNLEPAYLPDHSYWSKARLEQLEKLECSPAVRQRLDMLILDLNYTQNQLSVIQRNLREFCREHDEIQEYMRYLVSIPGIGFINGITFLGIIGDPSNLRNQREIASFLGLSPSEHSTGDNIKRGHITHLGNKELRRLLVEAAWTTIRKNNQLNQFYYRIRRRHHERYAANIAITAVARKMTQIIYRVLKDKRVYINYS